MSMTKAELELEVERLEGVIRNHRENVERVLSDTADRALQIDADAAGDDEAYDARYARLAGLYESTLYALSLGVDFPRRSVFIGRRLSRGGS